MRALIRRFDAFLRWAYGVFDFHSDEECLLRLQLGRAPHLLNFSTQAVASGEPVLFLHLWNEHIPAWSSRGPDLAWASRVRRLLVQSLHMAAQELAANPRLKGVRAVGGVTVLLPPGDYSSGARLMGRLGFSVEPYRNPLGRFGEFWENFYSWWIMWTFNPASLRRRNLLGLRRAEIWMPAEEFLRRYGVSHQG